MSTNIGRFEIVTELAKSASGAVYKANDPGAGRTVALKTIRLDLPPDLSRILIQLILQEAENTKVLNSQNIALLYGAGEIEGQFCAAMEYVEGNSLCNMIARQEGFSIWDLLDISRQVCLALDHADSHGVLHRSLEPAKIMMQWDGTVKVLGYGVSTMVSAMPRAGANVPPLFYYMSPEQVKGEVMDVRSNIFSWGAILYEMVTERKPFIGENVQAVRQRILEETPEPPATINPRINLGVSRVIMQALSKSPEERYQRGQELLIDLEKAKETTQAKAAKQAAQSPRGLVIPDKLKAPATGSSKFIVPKTSEAAETSTGETRTASKSTTPAAHVSGGRAPAKSATSGPGTLADGLMNSAGAEVTPPPKKAAAAAAGVGGRPGTQAVAPRATVKPQAGGNRKPIESMSAATAEPEVQEPKFHVDPMMAEGGAGSSSKQVSFSDLEELPPLKPIDTMPPLPSAPTHELQELPRFSMQPRVIKEEKPKIVTRENARKAVNEIKKVPPKLMLYAVSGAAVVILAVVIGMWMYIHHQNSDDDVAPSPTATTEVPAEPTTAAAPVQAATDPVQPEPEVIVKPRYAPPKRVKAAPVKAAIVPGQLAVNSTPEGAQVQIDGRGDASWMTPYTLTGLAPGQHTVAVSKSGFALETRVVDVTSGSKSFLVVHLATLGAILALSSEPAGASLFIDGKDSGRLTPAQIIADKGTHTILVRKQGYLDETTTVDLQSGQNFHYSPILKALGITEDIKTGGKFKKLFGGESTAGMGKVAVKTQPKGAQITVNRRMVDKASPVDFYLNPGNYMIDITLSGYKPIHRVISIERGSKVELNENMEPQ